MASSFSIADAVLVSPARTAADRSFCSVWKRRMSLFPVKVFFLSLRLEGVLGATSESARCTTDADLRVMGSLRLRELGIVRDLQAWSGIRSSTWALNDDIIKRDLSS